MRDKIPAKRINIVSLKMVKEASFLYERRKISGPKDAAIILEEFLQDSDRERFIIICLNKKNEPTTISTISVGSLNASIIHPREVFKTALMANSAGIILSHNHPSGDPTPSQEDLSVTKRLVEAGNLIGIEITDHIILGRDGDFVSFKEKGLI